MASNLFWFYDVLIIGIALIYLYVGKNRGLMRSVVLVALTVVSVGVSWLACQIAAPIVYDSFFKEPILNALIDSSQKTDPVAVVSGAVSSGGYGVEMTNPEVEDVITKGGDFFQNIAGEIKNNGASESETSIESGMEESVTESMLKALVGDVVSPSVLTEILGSVSDAENSVKNVVSIFLNGDRSATAAAVESKIVAPAVKAIIRGIIWIVVMFVLLFLSRFIANLFKSINKVPIIGPINSILGAVLGLAEGLVVIYLISQVVRMICYFTSNSLMFLNVETVRETYLFKYLFYFDVMTLIG